MKRLKLMIGILGIGFMLGACRNKTNRATEDNTTAADTLETTHGVPLDNIHRSRPTDTVRKSNAVKKQGLPLDNLDRDKNAY